METGNVKNTRSRGILIIAFLLITACLTAQTGKISGVITDKNKETLPGANVLIVGTNLGAITDLDGNYTLNNIKPGTYKVQISFISYKSVIIDAVRVEADKTTLLNADLEEVSVTLQNVEVIAVKKNGSEISMINAIKSNQVVASGISSQQIQRSQDRDASEVVKRIPGITIIDDRFIVIRGLNQRYNNVWLNNSATPSSETDIKAFSFDVIPSSQIENIMIYKSPAPEIPSEFAGGLVKIFTKNMPEGNSYTFSYSSSYASGTTFNDFYKFSGGKYDALGFGDGSRDLPSFFPSNLQNASNTDQVEYGKRLNSNWTPRVVNAIPDQKASFAMTHRIKMGKTTLGEITSINYSISKDFNQVVNRNYGVYNFEKNTPSMDFDFLDSTYSQSAKVGIMNNWALFLGTKNKIEFRNLYSHQGKSKTSIRNGREYYSNTQIRSIEDGYLSRTTYSGQLSGSHSLKNDNSKIDWVAGYALAFRDEPDLKRAKQNLNENENDANYLKYGLFIPTSPLSSNAGRLFMDMNEDIISANLNLDQKISLGNYKPSMKAGIYYEQKSRTFNARKLGYVYSNPNQRDQSIQYLPVEELLSGQYFNTSTGIKLAEETSKSDSYDADNNMLAGYLAFNLPVGKRINVYAGARFEKNKQTLDSYDRLQQPIKVVNDTLNIFPSANVTYNFNDKNLLRFAYGKSINRPEFREIAPFPFYDFENNAVFSGNPALKNAFIDNFDLRYEYYPSQGETFSFGLFYKHFENPIEIKYAETGSGLEYTYQNANEAKNYGAEVEIRKSLSNLELLKKITLSLNGALIKSNIKFNNKTTDLDRPMAGQSPYVVNAGIYYEDTEKSKLMVSLLYNVIGKRIYIVGLPKEHSWENIPDVYELPRNLLDLTISKRIGKYVEIKGGIKDILNQSIRYQQNIDTNVDKGLYDSGESRIENVKATQVIRSFKPGSYYTLGIQVKF
jgi:TonB-dependent receptor